MCIIIDNDCATLINSESFIVDFGPVIDWLTSPKKNGILVFGGKLSIELNKNIKVRRFLKALQQAGRAKMIPDSIIKSEVKVIKSVCKSNDSHVIALARVSGARVLCSHDASLHQDFFNRSLISNPKGHVYQNKSHGRLLELYGHTPACGVRL